VIEPQSRQLNSSRSHSLYCYSAAREKSAKPSILLLENKVGLCSLTGYLLTQYQQLEVRGVGNTNCDE
jgi:hypothetical protein